MIDLVQFTTVHSRSDPRIRYKQADSLARHFPGRVALFVQDGEGDAQDPETGLCIVDTGPRSRGRLARMLLGSWRMYRAVRAARPKIAHFHDPELIPAGLALRASGVRVIYDMHEDLPRQILAKTYIRPAFLRPVLARAVNAFERFAVRRFAGSVAAVQSIADRFPDTCVQVIRNVPRAGLLLRGPAVVRTQERFVISYAGALSELRGILDMVAALDLLPDEYELQLLGRWESKAFFEKCQAHPGWRRCRYLGQVPHSEVGSYMRQAHLGVQMVRDIPNYRGGLATKVFEYLFLGIPTLMSDTADRRATYGELTHYARPGDPAAVAAAIRAIAAEYETHVARVREQHAQVLADYSWETEAHALMTVYEEILAPAKAA